MNQAEKRKRLRGYLKGYRDCQAQAREIERMLSSGVIIDAVREPLVRAKEEFEHHCANVQLIMSFAQDGLERRILNALFVFGKGMKDVARETKYSLGYCANVESKAINRLCKNGFIMLLIDDKGDSEQKM